MPYLSVLLLVKTQSNLQGGCVDNPTATPKHPIDPLQALDFKYRKWSFPITLPLRLVYALCMVFYWEYSVYSYTGTLQFPHPLGILRSAIKIFTLDYNVAQHQNFYVSLLHSSLRSIPAIVLGLLFVTMLGILTSRVKLIKDILLGPLLVVRSWPNTAVLVYFTLAFGNSYIPKFAAIFYAVVFAGWIQIHRAGEKVQETWMLQMRRRDRLVKHILPGIWTTLMIAYEIGVTVGNLLVIIGELGLVDALKRPLPGIGMMYWSFASEGSKDVNAMFVILFVIAGSTFVLVKVVLSAAHWVGRKIGVEHPLPNRH